MINDLKDENNYLRARDTDARALLRTAASVERQADIEADERRRIEENARIRSDNDLATIARLRDEHDDVRRHVWDRNQEIASLQDQIDRMRAINAEKDNELKHLTADN